jgi:hypothetical protein
VAKTVFNDLKQRLGCCTVSVKFGENCVQDLYLTPLVALPASRSVFSHHVVDPYSQQTFVLITTRVLKLIPRQTIKFVVDHCCFTATMQDRRNSAFGLLFRQSLHQILRITQKFLIGSRVSAALLDEIISSYKFCDPLASG